MSPTETIHPPARLLVRGVNWLGDAVMTTPALQRLRQASPKSHITLLTHRKLTGLWLNHPSLNAIITFAPDESVLSVASRIRQGKFDAALVFPNSPRSALEVWLAGVPQRIGYARPWRNFCLTHRIADRPGGVKMAKRSAEEIRRCISDPEFQNHTKPISAEAHQMHEYLHLVAALGANPQPIAPFVAILREEIQSVAAKFGLARKTGSCTGDSALFGLNAGAEYGPAKRWPIERFVSSAAQIQKRTRCRWLIFGGPNDESLGADIATGILKQTSASSETGKEQVINLAGKTTLRELCVLLKLCRVLLTNDSGPMHVAAAVGTPVVVPFGSTSPELTGPGLPASASAHILRGTAPCSPCFLRVCPIDMRCMTGIAETQVTEAVVEAANC